MVLVLRHSIENRSINISMDTKDELFNSKLESIVRKITRH